MHSITQIYQKMNLLLSCLLKAILQIKRMSFGCLKRHCMGCAAHLIIGTTCSRRFLKILGLPCLRTIHVCFQVWYNHLISLPTLLFLNLSLYTSASTSTTLPSSPKIHKKKKCTSKPSLPAPQYQLIGLERLAIFWAQYLIGKGTPRVTYLFSSPSLPSLNTLLIVLLLTNSHLCQI